MSQTEGAPLVNAATAILSMRSSSFDELSAYGEVVDNSIQANAANVKIKFDTTSRDIRKPVSYTHLTLPTTPYV